METLATSDRKRADEEVAASQKLLPLRLGADGDDTILVPEEVAREMQRLAGEVGCFPSVRTHVCG